MPLAVQLTGKGIARREMSCPGMVRPVPANAGDQAVGRGKGERRWST